MKKTARILSLVFLVLLVVSILVACSGGKDPAVQKKDDPVKTEEPAPVTDPGEKEGENEGETGKGEYCVFFVVTDPESGEELSKVEQEVKKSKDAYPPKKTDFGDYILDGWDSDGDGKADTGYKKVTCDMTVRAILRKKQLFTVTLLDEAGNNVLGKIEVRENDQLTMEAVNKAIKVPVKSGYFYDGITAADDTGIQTGMITGDCKFKITYRVADGTVPLVEKGTIQVDGLEDDAYKNAVLLPVDIHRQADNASDRKDAQITDKTVGKIVWDGEYVYVLVSVNDPTLIQRGEYYLTQVANGWVNDAAELFYSFEKNDMRERSETKLGVSPTAAEGMQKYAVSLTSGIMGGRSTHFEEVKIGVKHAYQTGADLDTTLDKSAKEGKYSYRVEIALPARTEGKAGAGADPATGLKKDAPAGSTDPKNYSFTEGEQLVAGDCIRFLLQINDLQYNLSSPDCEVREFTAEDAEAGLKPGFAYFLNKADNTTVSSIPFCASGHNQYELKYYLNFVLNDKDEGETVVYGYNEQNNGVGKDGKTVVRDYSK